MSATGKPSGGQVLPRRITDPESGVTAMVAGKISTGVGFKYKVVVVSFDDLQQVVAFSLDTAIQLVESLQKQIEHLRGRMN
jgi:hypothetical protein